MAGSNDDNQDDKTETATQYRRDEFRKQGMVAMSREVLSVCLLMASGVTLYAVSQNFVPQFRILAEAYLKFDHIETMTRGALFDLLLIGLKSWAWMVIPVFAVALLVAILACAAQVGFHVTWDPLTPKWDRLDPMKGLQRILSGQGATEAFKAVMKLGLGSWIVWAFVNARIPEAAHVFEKDIPEICIFFGKELGRLFFLLLGTFGILAAADYFFQRYRLEKQMRMSKREIREEYKLREGDPVMKGRIRNIQRRMASKRMMDAVPKADVIVTNPTHISIALKYDATNMAAPQVIAKGADHMAMKIRELAKKSGIPLVENKPLARTLYKEVDVGHYVPRDLYRAVAQVLAYVYRLKNGDWNTSQQTASSF
jgi:flagellar biosynthesis protein FlhB